MRHVDRDRRSPKASNEPEWKRLARNAAASTDATHEPELLRELLSFELGTAPYAIPVERVREIIRLREVTPMPRVPACVTGVVALRGEVVQVIDMRMRLGLEVTPPTRRSRVIILHGDDNRVTGICVDAVQEVLRVKEDDIDTATTDANGIVAALCKRGNEFVSLVDLDNLLALNES